MPFLLLNSIALDPHRWTPEKIPFFRLADLLPDLARRDFRRLELWQYHLSTLSPGEVTALQERAAGLGISFPVVGLYPVLHLRGAARDEERWRMDRLVEDAARLGAEVVKCFAGSLAAADVDAAAFERSVDFTRHLAAMAARDGLYLTLETHPDTLCDSVEATRRFIRAVDAPNLRVCFQPYDFADSRRAVQDLEALRDDVIHVHLQGRRADRISLLEEADLDYDPIFRSLEEGGFDGHLCIEFVRSGLVEHAADLDLDAVLSDAARDRAFVLRLAKAAGMLVDS